MGKTKNSRYKIIKALKENELPYWKTNVSNDFSRHPNRKRPRHTLVKEWRESKSYYNGWLMNYYQHDGRLGDCYDRSDRNIGKKRSVHGIRRAYEKELIMKELNNIEQD